MKFYLFQGSLLFVTYTIIQGIISSEMLVANVCGLDIRYINLSLILFVSDQR